MGNSQSQDEEEKVGYRVLGVQSGSPGSVAGFVSFFDFVIAANGVPLRSMDTTFVDLIKNSEEVPLILTVYNCKSHTIRETVVTPSRKWNGEGLLGVIIRFDTFHEAEEHMCHVLDIEMNSPAELAGLQPQSDYLLGTVDTVFKNTDILFDILKANIDKPLEFYVYNANTDEVRLSVIMPSTDWGGSGILGASVACGYLHSLPAKCCQSVGVSYEGTTKGVLQSPFGHYNIESQDHSLSLDNMQLLTPDDPPQVQTSIQVPLSQPVSSTTVEVPPSDQPLSSVHVSSSSFKTVHNNDTSMLVQTTSSSVETFRVDNDNVNNNSTNTIKKSSEIPSAIALTKDETVNEASKPIVIVSTSKKEDVSSRKSSSGLSFGNMLSFFDGNPPTEEQ